MTNPKIGTEGALDALNRLYDENSEGMSRLAMTDPNPQENIKRECGSCSECCRGWLSTKVYEQTLYPGQPCHFVGENGCSIYENRPEHPCRYFKCQWLIDTNIPEWMKPDKCKVILTNRDWPHNGEAKGCYWTAVEAGQQIDSKVLAWLFEVHLNHGIPMRIQVAGGHRWYGSEEFMEFASSL